MLYPIMTIINLLSRKMNPMIHVTRKWIYQYEAQFDKMSAMTEADIQKIWKQPAEEKKSDYTAMEAD